MFLFVSFHCSTDDVVGGFSAGAPDVGVVREQPMGLRPSLRKPTSNLAYSNSNLPAWPVKTARK
jgi:hypothetical protein